MTDHTIIGEELSRDGIPEHIIVIGDLVEKPTPEQLRRVQPERQTIIERTFD